MKPITAVILGAGSRGTNYAGYAKEHPDELQIVGVAEPNPQRRSHLAEELQIPADCCFAGWQDVLDRPRFADCVFVCTMDDDHTAPAIRAMELGYHVLLEKPMSNTEEECRIIADAARRTGRVLTVCHVLRYTPFYMTLKSLIEAGEIGTVTAINQIENVAYWHHAHSFVRGNWRTTRETSPMILQKSCHDMDILLWLTGKTLKSISSYGDTYLFRADKAPAGAALRCLDGCKAKETCPYDAEKIYITNKRTGVAHGHTGWPCDVLTLHPTEESIRAALETGPYGRCVYHCDNNVVDHQVVNMLMTDGSTIHFTMCAFTSGGGRYTRFMGTQGDIVADMEKNTIAVTRYGQETEVIDVSKLTSDFAGHGGGDSRMVEEFLDNLINGGEPTIRTTSLGRSIESHFACMAAEKSRKEGGRVVELDEIRGK